MPSEGLETIFRRDLDRLPGLAEDQWVPRAGHSEQAFGLGNALALASVVLAAVVVVLSSQAIRDADRSQQESAASPIPYFVIESAAAARTASPGQGVTPSPAATWLVGPPASNPLLGVPTCPLGSSPILRVTFGPPPGDLPGTGAATAEAAFRRSYPAVTEFTMYAFSPNAPAFWIVAGGDTYVVN
jgi:hypothetical protein